MSHMREVTGSVTSGNFCGYLSPDRRESYYTLLFRRPNSTSPSRRGAPGRIRRLPKARVSARGGTTYGDRGHPPGRKGSGAWISFDPAKAPVVTMRVGISYVSLANARANLAAEEPNGTTLEQCARRGARGVECAARPDRRRRGHEGGAHRVLYRALSCAARPEHLQRCRRRVSRIRQERAQGRGAAACAVCEFLRLGCLSLAASTGDVARSEDRFRHRAVAAQPGEPERRRVGSLDASHRRHQRDERRSVAAGDGRDLCLRRPRFRSRRARMRRC